jgi:hypothetical protein
MDMNLRLPVVLLLFFALASCESAEERHIRVAQKERERIELEERVMRRREEGKRQAEQERVEEEQRLTREREDKAIYDKYISNSLSTGALPYSYCFGTNQSCSGNKCSEIKVKTPSNSEVLVIIKQGGDVVRHAYIGSSSSLTFELPNGTYQPFFYYGNGWNPEKMMKEADCGTLRGGFIADEQFGKDEPQYLSNNILEYELILQQQGNFSTRPSNPAEAF